MHTTFCQPLSPPPPPTHHRPCSGNDAGLFSVRGPVAISCVNKQHLGFRRRRTVLCQAPRAHHYTTGAGQARDDPVKNTDAVFGCGSIQGSFIQAAGWTAPMTLGKSVMPPRFQRAVYYLYTIHRVDWPAVTRTLVINFVEYFDIFFSRKVEST